MYIVVRMNSPPPRTAPSVWSIEPAAQHYTIYYIFDTVPYSTGCIHIYISLYICIYIYI